MIKDVSHIAFGIRASKVSSSFPVISFSKGSTSNVMIGPTYSTDKDWFYYQMTLGVLLQQ